MTESIELKGEGGATTRGELAKPTGSGKGGVVIAHEWWGLNDDIRSLTDRFAAEGFFALAVDLYGGASTTDAAEAMRLSNELKTPLAMKVVSAGVSTLRATAGCNGNVAVTGFCLGGAMAFAAAALVPGIVAAVPFYGIAKDEYVDWTKLRVPVQGHFGARDGFISPDRARRIAETVNASGGSFELHMYEAGHAFMRAHDPQAYDAPSAKLAWERAIAFLHRALDERSGA